MKVMRIVTVLCWIIVAAVLLGLAGWFLTGTLIGVRSDRFDVNWPLGSDSNFGAFESLSGPYEPDGVYTRGIEGINAIKIDWVAGSITVKPHDGDEILITEFAQRALGSEEKLQMSTSGGTLNIKYRERSASLRSISMPQKRLEVLVPRAFGESLAKLSVDTVSGNVYIGDVGPDIVKIDSTSGDITLTNISSLGLDSNSLSGSISLSNVTADAIGLESTSGSITVVTSNAGEIEIDSLSGGVRVSDSSASLFDAETTSGNLTVSGAFNSARLESLSGRISLDNSAESSVVDAETTSGNMDLSGSFSKVSVESLSGDISVNSRILPASLKSDMTSGNLTVAVPNESAVSVYHSSTSGKFSSDIPILIQGRGAQFEFSSLSGNVKIVARG